MTVVNNMNEEYTLSVDFDNSEFQPKINETIDALDKFKKSLNFEGFAKGVTEVNEAIKKIDINPIAHATEGLLNTFNTLAGRIKFNFVDDIAKNVVSTSKSLIKQMSDIEGMTKGWDKYNQKNESVQTIMAATGKSIDEVSSSLQRLGWFTDETSYRYSEMVNTIGKFTANGVELETSVDAMQGIATWAARSGVSASKASTAFYNLAQAIGTGALKSQDWKSLELVNLTTKEFKQNALDTAVALGRLKLETDGTYKVIDQATKKVTKHEVTLEGMRDSLQHGWFDKEVILDTLKIYGEFATKLNNVVDAAQDFNGAVTTKQVKDSIEQYATATNKVAVEAELVSKYGKEATESLKQLAEQYDTVGWAAFENAQETKSFTDAIDYVKEAVASGWAKTFEIIFGNYEEATRLWSDFSEGLYDVFVAGGEARNSWLEEVFRDTSVADDILTADVFNWDLWKANGIDSSEMVAEAVLKVAEAQGIVTDRTLGAKGAFEDLLTKGKLRWSMITEAIDKVADSTGNATTALSALEEAADSIWISGKYGIGMERSKKLTDEFGDSAKLVQKIVNKKYYSDIYGPWEGLASLTEEEIELLGEVNGLTKEQIEQAKELQKAINEDGTALNDLNKLFIKPTGRELLLETLYIVGADLRDTIVLLREEFTRLFGLDSSTVYGWIESFNNVVKAAHEGEYMTKGLTVALETLSAAVQILNTTFSGIFRIGKHIVDTIAKPLFTHVSNLIPKIDGLNTKLINLQTILDTINAIVEWCIDGISNLTVAFVDWYNSVDGDAVVVASINGIKDAFEGLIGMVASFSFPEFDGFVSAVSSLQTSMAGVASWAKGKFSSVFGSEIDFFKFADYDGMAKNVEANLNGAFSKMDLNGIISSIGTFDIAKTFSSLFTGFTSGEAEEFAHGGSKQYVAASVETQKATEALENMVSSLGDFVGAFSTTFKGIGSGLEKSLNTMIDFCVFLSNSVSTLYTAFSTAVSNTIGAKLIAIAEGATSWLDILTSLFTVVIDFMMKIPYQKIFKLLSVITVFSVLRNVFKAIFVFADFAVETGKTFKEILDSLKDVFATLTKSVGNFIESLGEIPKAVGKVISAEASKFEMEAFKAFAESIAIIVFTFVALYYLLKDAKFEDIVPPLLMMITIIGIMWTLMYLLNRFSDTFKPAFHDVKDWKTAIANMFEPFKGITQAAQLLALGVLVGVLVAAMFAVIQLIKVADKLILLNPTRTFLILAGVFAALVAAIVVINKSMKGQGLTAFASILSTTVMLVAILAAMWAVIKMGKSLADITSAQGLGIVAAIAIIGAIVTAMSMLVWSLKGKAVDLFAGAVLIISFALGIEVISKALARLQNAGVSVWTYAGVAAIMGILGAVLVEVLGAMAGIAVTLGTAAGVVAAVTGLITATTNAISKLKDISWPEYLKAIIMLGVVLVEFVVVLKLLKVVGEISGDKGMNVTLGSMAACILAISFAIWLLKDLDFGEGLAAAAALGIVIVALGFALSLAKQTGSDWKTVSAFALVIISLAAVMWVLAEFGNPSKILAIAVAFGVVFTTLAATFSQIRKMNFSSFLTILSMAAFVATLAAAFYVLQEIPADRLKALTRSISILMGVVAAVTSLLMFVQSKTKVTGMNMLAPIITMIAVVGSLAAMMYALYLLSDAIDDVDKFSKVVDKIAMISLVIGTIAAVGTVLGATGFTGVKNAAMFALAIDAVVVVVVAMLALLGVLADINNGGVGNAAVRGAELIGQVIGALFGGIVGEYNKKSVAGLNEAHNEMIRFANGMKEFIDELDSIDDKAISKLDVIGKFVDALQKVGNWNKKSTYNLKTFSEGMKEVAPAYNDFATVLSQNEDIDMDKVNTFCNVLVAIAEAAKKIPNQGGAIANIMGDNMIGPFLRQLAGEGTDGRASLATVIAQAGEALKGISDQDFENITKCATAIGQIATAAEKIPNEGGLPAMLVGDNNIGGFLNQIGGSDLGANQKNFGTIMSEAAASLANVTESDWANVTNSIGAIRDLVDVANSIQPMKDGFFEKTLSIAEFLHSLIDTGYGKGIGDMLYIYGTQVGNMTQHDYSNVSRATFEIGKLFDVVGKLDLTMGNDYSGLTIQTQALIAMIDNMADLGTSVKDFAFNISDVDGRTWALAERSMEYMVKLINVVSGGTLDGAVTFDSTKMQAFIDCLPTFADSDLLANAGASINKFAANASTGNYENCDKAAEALAILIDALCSNFNSVAPINSESVLIFSEHAGLLGNAIKDFSTAAQGTDTNTVSMQAAAVSDLADSIIKINNISENGLYMFENIIESLGKISSTEIVRAIQSNVENQVAIMVDLGKGIATRIVEGLVNAMPTQAVAAINGIRGELTKEMLRQDGKFKLLGKDYIAKPVGTGIEDGKISLTSSMFSTISYMCDAVQTDGNILVMLNNLGKFLIEGMVNGIVENQQYATEAMATAATAVVNAGNKAAEVNSPSKATYETGKWLMYGLGDAITDYSSYASGAMSGAVGDTLSSMQSVISQIAETMTQDIDPNPTITPLVDLSGVKTGAAAIASMMNKDYGLRLNTTNSLAFAGANQNGMSGYGNMTIENITIDAKNVKEFNDVVEIMRNQQRYTRMGRG